MLDVNELRREHHDIMVLAANLRGLGDMVKTRQDAEEARGAIDRIDKILTAHLTREDDDFYPALVDCRDLSVAALAADCAEEMGGVLGAWIAYRDQWTAAAILLDAPRFGGATAGIMGALALRVEREDAELYPAVDRLST